MKVKAGCDVCAFKNIRSCKDIPATCMACDRIDNTGVHFKKIRK